MNIKKEVIENIKAHLESQQSDIRHRLKGNIRQMRDLEREQTILKRTLAKYGELLGDL